MSALIPEALGHALLHKMHLEIPNAAVLVGCWSNEQIIAFPRRSWDPVDNAANPGNCGDVV